MKKITLLLFIVSGIISKSISQDFWEPVNLPNPDMTIYAMATDGNDRLFIGSVDNIYYTDNNGANWNAGTNWPGHAIKCLAVNDVNIVFAGTFSEGMYRSTDGGTTYTEINNGLSYLNVWCIFIIDEDELLVGTPGGIFKSADNGDNWAPLGNISYDVQAIVIDENDYLYAGTHGEGVFKSENNGITWNAVNNGIPDSSQVTAMAAVPLGGVLAAFFPEGVYRTTDQGASWVEFNEGLPFADKSASERGPSVVGFVFVLGILMLIIYYMGMYWINFAAAILIWAALFSGLPMNPTTSSITSNTNNDVYIGTYDQGLYKNALPVNIEEINENVAGFEVFNVYPNPAGEFASFEICIPQQCKLSANVVNQLGQICMPLVSKEFNPGKFKIHFNTQTLKPGIYFIKIFSDKNIKTVKYLKK